MTTKTTSEMPKIDLKKLRDDLNKYEFALARRIINSTEDFGHIRSRKPFSGTLDPQGLAAVAIWREVLSRIGILQITEPSGIDSFLESNDLEHIATTIIENIEEESK